MGKHFIYLQLYIYRQICGAHLLSFILAILARAPISLSAFIFIHLIIKLFVPW